MNRTGTNNLLPTSRRLGLIITHKVGNVITHVDFLDKDDLLISLGCNNDNIFTDLLSIIPLQFLSYYIALNKNYNPDMPRNLAKVVTVE